jgi:transposase
MNLSPCNCSVKMSPMNKEVTLNAKEQKRLKVLNEVEAHRLTGLEASELLGISLRQVRRLLAAYRKEGAAGLAHGNRGQISRRRLSETMRARILGLAQSTYLDYNDQHFCEELAERYGLGVSRSTVRRLRRAAGLGSPRKRRAPRHRQRRPRYPQPGMLLQIDASPHDWLEGRGPWLTLVVSIDDATNEIPSALFRAEEDATGYFLLLQGVCQSHGLPLALYADRHTIFQSPKEPTIDQQLEGKLPRSQFGRLADELCIRLIPAQSPQAKGRVERVFGTLQDRLVKALREAGAASLEEANQVLHDFLPRYNRRFMQRPAQPGSAYRTQPSYRQVALCFCFKHQRSVANDNTVSFDGHKLQIPPGPHQRSYARARVDLRQHLDGHVSIHYQGQLLATFQSERPEVLRVGKFTPACSSEDAQPQPVRSEPLPALKLPKPRPKPAPDHPWRHAAIGARATGSRNEQP